MTEMMLEANQILTAALARPVPLVLRDYEAMMPTIRAFVSAAKDAFATYSAIELSATPHEHSDACEACTILKNVNLRYRHDLDLLALQADVCGSLQERISRSDAINRAVSDDLLPVCLATRAMLDNLVRSSVLFLMRDIRIYNKYLAESLTSLQKLEWSTLPQSIGEEAIPLLNTYNGLSGSERNDSELFADPFPTFAAKVRYLRETNKDPGFEPTLDMISKLFGALSDLVHGGIAFLTVANPNIPQIIVGRRPLRYTPFTYQVAEFMGLSMAAILKAFGTLYVPALIQSLGGVVGTEGIAAELQAHQRVTMARVAEMMF
jgi:hypothetical protein